MSFNGKIIAKLFFFVMSSFLFANAAGIPGLVSADSVPHKIVSGLISPEGPVCDTLGQLYYCDFVAVPDNQRRGKVYKIGLDTPYVKNLDVPSGLAFDNQNRLIISGQNKIWRRESSGSLTTLAFGDSLKQANDISLTSKGGLFFTANNWSTACYVYFLSETGKLSSKLLEYPGSQGFPNGIEYWEEKGKLLVCLSQLNCIMSYKVNNQMQVDTNGALFANVTGPDGLTIDEKGNVWVAAGNKTIAVFDSTGKSLGSVVVGSSVTNVCFGGPTGKTLYITGGDGVFALSTLVKGRKIGFSTSVKSNLLKGASVKAISRSIVKTGDRRNATQVVYKRESEKKSNYSISGKLVKK